MPEVTSRSVAASHSAVLSLLRTIAFADHNAVGLQNSRRPDKEGGQVDILFVQDGTLIPMEVKKSASPRREWCRSFSRLGRLKQPVGQGAVLCLAPNILPLSDTINAVPIGMV